MSFHCFVLFVCFFSCGHGALKELERFICEATALTLQAHLHETHSCQVRRKMLCLMSVGVFAMLWVISLMIV